MNKYIKIFLVAIIFACGLNSCNDKVVFQKEQYKNVFALVSGTDNVSDWYHDLRKDESLGYVSASLGGTNPSTKDVKVSLVLDNKLIDTYNSNIFDVNTAKYILPLASSKFTIDNYNFTIPTGEVKASIPVKIRPAGLSPDSTYFIPLRVDSYSGYEINPKKDYILYRVSIKNWWSVTGGTAYNQRGNRLAVGSTGNPVQVFGTKRLYPLTANKVRLLAGTVLNDNASIHIFNWYSMTMTIGDDNKVKLEPYKTLEMTQIDGDVDFPNKVILENDGFKTFKTFLLCYSYKHSDGVSYKIKEELRLEYKEDPKDPRFF